MSSPWLGPALFPRGTRLLLLNGYLASLPMGFLMVVMPLYLARVGFEPAFIGLLYAISGIVTSVLVAFSGILADRLGRVRFLVAGTALPIASYVIFILTTDRAWLVVASAVGGVGLANGAAGALTVGSYDALLAERSSAARRTTVFATSQALWNLALATGAATAAVPQLLRSMGVDPIASYRPTFAAAIVAALLATALILPLREAGHAASGPRSGWLPRASARPIATYSLGIGLLGFGLGVAVQLMPLWLNLRFGIGEADLAPWYTAAQLASIASVGVVPWMDRRFGATRSVLGMQVVSGLALAAMVGAPVFWIAGVLFLSRSFLTNISWPFQQSLLMGAVEPRERGAAAGIGFAVWGVANALGPGIGGYLLGTGILALPILAGAIAYSAAGIVFGIGFGRIHAAAGRSPATAVGLPVPPPEPLP